MTFRNFGIKLKMTRWWDVKPYSINQSTPFPSLSHLFFGHKSLTPPLAAKCRAVTSAAPLVVYARRSAAIPP